MQTKHMALCVSDMAQKFKKKSFLHWRFTPNSAAIIGGKCQ